MSWKRKRSRGTSSLCWKKVSESKGCYSEIYILQYILTFQRVSVFLQPCLPHSRPVTYSPLLSFSLPPPLPLSIHMYMFRAKVFCTQRRWCLGELTICLIHESTKETTSPALFFSPTFLIQPLGELTRQESLTCYRNSTYKDHEFASICLFISLSNVPPKLPYFRLRSSSYFPIGFTCSTSFPLFSSNLHPQWESWMIHLLNCDTPDRINALR